MTPVEHRGAATRHGAPMQIWLKVNGAVHQLDIAPGETPIIAVAPAIGTAIADATGVRLRSLPMIPKGFSVPTEQ